MGADAGVKESSLAVSTAVNAGEANRGEAKRSWSRAGWRQAVAALVVLGGGLLLWEMLVRWQEYPPFILPAPMVVARRFGTALADGTLWRHTWVTLVEIGLGLALGLSLALLLGYILGKNRALERVASPWIVASQSIPIVAIAPLLVIWFGSGMLSKVLVTALITFFPTLVATIIGLRSVDADLRDLMRSLKASRRQTFLWLELPSALPVIFGGLKLSVILAVVGAVVGEFVAASAGLGFLINFARGVLDTPLLFVAILCLVLIAQALYWSVVWIEHRTLRWQRDG
jgi:NitT/TauT family transport system permease protein